MALSFSWTGSNLGVWNNTANWTDDTVAPIPATAPPGAADDATLTGGTNRLLVVSGPGQANTLTTANQVELNGVINVGSLVQSGILATVSGSLVASSGATFSGLVDQVGGGMMVNGLAIDGGTLTVEPGAFMEVGNAGGADGTYALVVDANATMTLDAGSLSVGSVLNLGSLLATASTSDPLSGSNFGLISGLSIDTLINFGTVASGTGQSVSVGNMSGGGEVDVSQGGTVAITQDDTAAVVFQGNAGTLSIAGAGLAGDALAVQGFNGSDVISIADAVTGVSFTPNGFGDGTLTTTTGAGSVSIDIQGNYDSSQTVAFVQNGTATLGQSLALPCFATGTCIMTRTGAVPVEALRAGDAVATLLPNGFRPVRWIGHRTIRLAAHPQPQAVQPVCVRAGAFGPGLPVRDLFLSPDHALFAEGALVPVKFLVDGDAITQRAVETVTYWHIELDRHDVLLAEGVPAESYLDTGDRACFTNAGGVATLHPKFGPLTWEAEGCAPLVVTGPVLDRLRATLRAYAGRPARQRHAA
ncbi:MAG: Hint domain-containing protein [Acetobacteraceae bacterium]|nr:Hint domain-containing protein [Acetobacteraceae bacterium]